MKKKSGLKSFKFHINSFPLCEKGILAHDPASPLEEKQKFGNCNITNQSQVRNFEDSNLLENKSEKTIRAAKYDQLLNDCLIDPLYLPRNILEDIPNWSHEFKLKFTCSITKEESTIQKYFRELAKFLKE